MEALLSLKKLVFVVGCQRSGTTLTGLMMGAPDHAILIDEDDGLYDWFSAMSEGTPSADLLLSNVLERAVKKHQTNAPYLMRNAQGRTIASPTIQYAVLKAPNLTYAFNAIANLPIPRTVLYPVRDPRAVVASMRRLSHVKMVENQIRLLAANPEIERIFPSEIAILRAHESSDLTKQAMVWLIKSSLQKQFATTDIEMMTFRYEDLVMHPETMARDIANRAGVDFDPKMTAHDKFYTGRAVGRTDRKRAVDQTSIGLWSSELSNDENQELKKLLGSRMQELGYA